jgi:hypothetical protein
VRCVRPQHERAERSPLLEITMARSPDPRDVLSAQTLQELPTSLRIITGQTQSVARCLEGQEVPAAESMLSRLEVIETVVSELELRLAALGAVAEPVASEELNEH